MGWGRSAKRYFGLARRIECVELEIRGIKVATSEKEEEWHNIFTYPDANESIAARTAVLMLLG